MTLQQHALTAFVLSLVTAAMITAPPRKTEAAIVKKSYEYSLAGKKYEGYLAYDDSKTGPLPGVLVAHNWMGVTDETKSKVDQLAELGYVAFAVDIYGKNSRPKNTEEAAALAGGFKKDRVPLRNRLHQGLKILREQKNVDKSKLAAVGYCFGGTAVLELARAGADVQGVVSFHGGLDSPKPDDGKRIKARVLALHGADDPFVPAAELVAFEEEMRKHKVDWQLVKYGGAVHSFTEKAAGNDNAKGAAYNEKADKRAWLAMRTFLGEIF
ncbi:MAG: dienelactone hydrolase family protein [Bdellovibrionales bacterium]|jgi:dienelactone hydrolase|nr:dienelactone hydrolase family protein [Bdellovibrionales bacterium]